MYDFTVRFMKNVTKDPSSSHLPQLMDFSLCLFDFSLYCSFARLQAQHCYTGGRDAFNCQRLR